MPKISLIRIFTIISFAVLIPAPAKAVSKYFPVISSSRQLLICERRSQSYAITEVYNISSTRYLRIGSVKNLSGSKKRQLRNKCRSGDTSQIGSLGIDSKSCLHADINHDGNIDRKDLKAMARSLKAINLSGSRELDGADLKSIRLCWDSAGIQATPTPNPTLPSPTPSGTPAFGLNQRTLVTGINFPLDDPNALGGSADVNLVRAFPSLTFSQPLFITSARDQSNRLFVVEKTGRIKVFPNSNSVGSSTIFLDLSTKIDSSGEQGLLGLAFDPDYLHNGNFFVYYSPSSGARRSVISRFHVSANSNIADASSESIILQVTQPASLSNHKGGMLAFGSDNMLYIALGDGGGGGDPSHTGQDCSDMLGNILRIDPRSASPYVVPPSNPFAGAGQHACGNLNSAPSRTCGINGYATGQICSEIWNYGLRNPWRFSFDRASGALWIGDVGQGAWEEIDIAHPGDNFGWNVFEGTHYYENPSNIPVSNFAAPIHEYAHDSSGGLSITGGYVYRGLQIPALYGKYVYGDYASGKIWALTFDGTGVSSNVEIASLANLSSFGEDEAGELYAINIGLGTISRFAAGQTGNPASIPTKLSLTGLFTDTAALQAAAGAIEYDVNAPLWSDAAIKRRWLYLPGSQQIGFDAQQAFSFPTGTALVKQFDLQIAPNQTRHVETRVFFKHNQGWAGYSYRWNAQQSDADLLTESAAEIFTIQDAAAPGEQRSQEWGYPSRAECFNCHTAPSGTILGLRTRQLNRNFDFPNASDNQLRAWNHIGLFDQNIGEASLYSAYSAYSDVTKPLAQRARSYLAANCSHCHQPAVPNPAAFDMRFDTAAAQMNLINVAPSSGDLGLNNPARIRPGNKNSSVVWERMRRLDGNRMPPLASSEVDQTGTALIGEWIDAGAPD